MSKKIRLDIIGYIQCVLFWNCLFKKNRIGKLEYTNSITPGATMWLNFILQSWVKSLRITVAGRFTCVLADMSY